MGFKYIEIYDLVQASPETYLMHHGIKGMKWGIRRYQNLDGTLTAAGKRRYFPNAKPSNKKSEVTLNQKTSKMSDAELRSRTDRLRLENNYKQEVVRSKSVATFYKRYGHYLTELSAASATVLALAKIGSKTIGPLIKARHLWGRGF